MRSLLDESGQPFMRNRGETKLSEAQTINVLEGAAELFREQSLRLQGAIPWVKAGKNALKSRKRKIIDIGEAEVNELGTGGAFDGLGLGWDDVPVLRPFKNIQVTDLELELIERDGGTPLRDAGQIGGEAVGLAENRIIADGGPGTPGITSVSGVQTFASAGAWTTPGDFWKDVIKAQGALWASGIPADQLALIGNPADVTNAFQVFSNTATPQSEVGKMMKMLPGGIYYNTNFDVGTVFFYAKIPTVVQLVVYEDLHVITLPRLDEAERLRVRESLALHFPRPSGFVKVTSVDV